MIVNSLNGGLPNGIWLVVISDSREQAFGWLREAGFDEESPPAHRVTVSSAEDVDKHLGVQVTPLAIDIENGRLTHARTVPSLRQFYALVPATTTFKLSVHQ